MFVPLTGPRSVLVLSPKLTTTSAMFVPLPAAGCTDPVNATSVPAVGFVVVVVIDTVGWSLAAMSTDPLPVDESPSVSVAVTRTEYQPGAL